MKGRRTVLYILLIILGVIFMYNYVLVPLLMQLNGGMGMGMHYRMGMYGRYMYYTDFRLMLFIMIMIGIFLLLDFVQGQNRSGKCKKCGYEIENDQWKICPLCGTAFKLRKDDKA
ncbi:zinc ribbon domain-containing protein [Thermotalea metallivorans]|uniref:Zinc ribbon domain-containing protein n=1 Tax=Thermotalea metallivorans TaxID=520762 RepID=A0A140L064_9FIRM|nr:zinc ribbon domain-containing protein [Thermotalea metallivorans]KXG73939.1 hypothetical protein AN619_27480 [Thermotalea metallivorans]